MAVSKKREESDVRIDRIVNDALNDREAQYDNDAENGHLEAIAKRLDESGAVNDPTLGDEDNKPSLSGSDAVESHADTLESILDKVDSDAKSKVQDAVDLDKRRVTQHVNPMIKMKSERTKKTYKGYMPFCLTVIAIGLVWLLVGIFTKTAWPVPFFGNWNIIWPAFMMLFGGLMMLDWR